MSVNNVSPLSIQLAELMC